MSNQWTVSELARAARQNGRKVSERHIRRLCDDNTINAVKVGRDWLIGDNAARQWILQWTGRDWRGNGKPQ